MQSARRPQRLAEGHFSVIEDADWWEAMPDGTEFAPDIL